MENTINIPLPHQKLVVTENFVVDQAADLLMVGRMNSLQGNSFYHYHSMTLALSSVDIYFIAQLNTIVNLTITGSLLLAA